MMEFFWSPAGGDKHTQLHTDYNSQHPSLSLSVLIYGVRLVNAYRYRMGLCRCGL